MIALIESDNKTYFSHVFALMKDGDDSLAVVFDTSENEFELISVYKSKYMSNQTLTLLDNKTDGLIEKEEIQLTSFKATECLGYEWLLNNPELLKAIEQGQEVDSKYVALAKELNSAIDLGKWHEVTNEEEAQELLDIAGGFHDSYIIGMNYKGSSNNIEMTTKIQLTFELYGGNRLIVLEFAGNVEIHYDFEPIFNGVYLSSIIFGEDCIYWVEGDDEYRLCDIDERSQYFKADQLRWKMIPKLD